MLKEELPDFLHVNTRLDRAVEAANAQTAHFMGSLKPFTDPSLYEFSPEPSLYPKSVSHFTESPKV